MEATKTWIDFYAKDYGGRAKIEARVYTDSAPGAQPSRVFTLSVPKDTDNDKLADKWEIAMADRWSTQYSITSITENQALEMFDPSSGWIWPIQDNEQRDPDGSALNEQGLEMRPLVAQKDTGDGHNILEEYRGYILDGGGFDGAGNNGFTGGHIRLDPARKEILVEADRAATLNNVPGTGALDEKLKSIMNGASKVFSNADRGAGIYMYYLFDQNDLNIAPNALAFPAAMDTLKATRSSQLKSDFLHLLLVDHGLVQNRIPPAVSWGRQKIGSPTDIDKRGSILATTDMDKSFPNTNYPKRDELLMTTVAHELVHQLIDVYEGAVFNDVEHTSNSNTNDPAHSDDDKTCIMYEAAPGEAPSAANEELATIKFFPVVQAELSTRTSEAFVL
jgi:hypothetical protein